MAEQHQSHSVTFQHEQQESVDLDARQKMILNQDGGWTELTGYMTEANFVRYTGSFIYGQDYYDPIRDCGMDGVYLETTIQAYPFSDSLQFNLYTSYGELGSGSVEYIDVSALISFKDSDSATVSYPIFSISESDWLGRVYDSNQKLTSTPSVSFDGDEVKLSKKVYGSVEVTYRTKRISYLLTVEPRENAESYETKFDTYVWAIYDQGLTWLKVSEPPNADDLAGGVPCGFINVDFHGPDDEPPDNPPPKDKNIEMDYCLLEEIGDGEGLV